VILTLAGTISFSVLNQTFRLRENANPMAMAQCLNTALKNAMINSMLAFDRLPRMFYVKLNSHTQDLLGNYLKTTASNTNCHPLAELMQTAALTGNGNVVLAADLSIG
jgi:hypothetical protein